LLFNLIIDGFLSRHCDESHCLFYETKINKKKQKKRKTEYQITLKILANARYYVWFSGRIMSEHRLNEEYNF